MRTLVIECATEACSIALFDGDDLVAGDHRLLGRGHAEHLVPMIAALPDRGKADRILVSLGPGSFTGVRIGIAVAGSLAVAWGSDVRGYPTLSLVAAVACAKSGIEGVTVCMAGGHGEWFVQDFVRGGRPLTALASLSPEAAVARGAMDRIAGTKADEFASLLGASARSDHLLPDARMLSQMDTTQISSDIGPIYGRGPDAKLPT